MNRLKDRQRQIPYGFKYYQPETKWDSTQVLGSHPSFDTLVSMLIAHRRANPFLSEKHHWSTEEAHVAMDVERYQVALCEQAGWKDYLAYAPPDPAPAPKSSPPLSILQRSGQLVAGAKTLLVDWLPSGAEAVSSEKSAQRAQVCSTCPMNLEGDMASFFTEPVANLIKVYLERRKGYNLSTPQDEQLGVCDACGCPLKLKVHMPIGNIITRLSGESKAALHSNCWITAESK